MTVVFNFKYFKLHGGDAAGRQELFLERQRSHEHQFGERRVAETSTTEVVSPAARERAANHSSAIGEDRNRMKTEINEMEAKSMTKDVRRATGGPWTRIMPSGFTTKTDGVRRTERLSASSRRDRNQQHKPYPHKRL